ncbi:hypothetical protein DFP90_101760 [Aestuariispira insulae]|uniref:Uncharacterized protein n=1 Tax=Aestuariispira insulae TaxID=1461337 RepID=A0A3D9HX50_9PROT|nr:hypothetical protein DFP90_101760 [Aestuariispira insulae]
MPNKMIPLSVRITEDDAAFLATLSYDGAASLSEKTRALIAEARRRRENQGHLDEALRVLEDIHSAQDSRRREVERQEEAHSELLSQFSRWLMDTHILFLEGAEAAGQSKSKEREGGKEAKGSRPSSKKAVRHESIIAYERRMADQIFLLMDLVMRQGLTENSRNYDPKVISSRMVEILELSRLLQKD